MATTFKNFTPDDIATTAKIFHEAIPVTGSIVSGTYLSGTTETNIKNYAHGMFQSVYDYPYLSSSANRIFDLSVGYANSSTLSSSANQQNSKKINMYNLMAQSLVGFDLTGSIRLFDQDCDFAAGGNKFKEIFIIPFTRLLVKDEIKKGSFQLSVYRSGSNASRSKLETLSDYGAATNYFVNQAGGECAMIFSSSANTGSTDGLGLIYYQQGVVILTASVFQQAFGMASVTSSWTGSVSTAFQSASIQQLADGFRHRVNSILFNNVTEINSTIYFCRKNANEFNYSSNPSYLSGSKIIVKGNNPQNQPISYATKVGLYNAQGELLAVCGASENFKFTPDVNVTIRCRLDY